MSICDNHESCRVVFLKVTCADTSEVVMGFIAVLGILRWGQLQHYWTINFLPTSLRSNIAYWILYSLKVLSYTYIVLYILFSVPVDIISLNMIAIIIQSNLSYSNSGCPKPRHYSKSLAFHDLFTGYNHCFLHITAEKNAIQNGGLLVGFFKWRQIALFEVNRRSRRLRIRSIVLR